MSILNTTVLSDFPIPQGNFSNPLYSDREAPQLINAKAWKDQHAIDKNTPNNQTFEIKTPFKLECGSVFNKLRINYTTYGKLNADASNVIWVCHALTADTNPHDWWQGLIGQKASFTPEEYFIICANVIGSPYGSTSPINCDPEKSHAHFPTISIRDNVHAFIQLRKHLKINKINTLIGGSMGGHQAMEWAIAETDVVENLILLASSAATSPWVVAFNQSQRLAILADNSYGNKTATAAQSGLKAARSIALLSYRNNKAYNQTQSDAFDFNETRKAASYQNYQGEKLVARFNVYSYYALTKTMDSHDVGRNRGGIALALKEIKAKTLIIGVDSDVLFPIEDSKQLADFIPHAEFHIIQSDFGHDGFLIETRQISEIIKTFIITIQ